MTCWPEAVQYLLRSYRTASAIREANRSLRETKQLPGEDELSYNTRLTKAILRCGSVHSAEAKKDLFVDGLQTATKAIVTRYREMHPSKTYLELLEHAKAEVETYRARFGTAKKPSQDGTKTRPVRTSGKALHADSSVEFRDRGSRTLSGLDTNTRRKDILHLLGDLPSSFPTSGLPTSTEDTRQTTETSVDEDPTLALGRGYASRTPAPRMAYNQGMRSERPGWVNRSQPPAPKPRPQGEVICYSCYEVNTHLSPD